MNELIKEVVNEILVESGETKRIIAVYAGRFQPFHAGHFSVYKLLVDKFGKNNVYIGTSNKVEKPKSPFSFKEKHKIITTMFPIPSNKVVQVKNPFSPVEILNKFDPETTAYVTAFGEKDAGRLGGRYFKQYNPKAELLGYKEQGYFVTAPVFQMKVGDTNVSGTAVRTVLGGNVDEEPKKKLFKHIYQGKFNQGVFDLITGKLAESVIVEKELLRYLKTRFSKVLKEASANIAATADDGPNYFYGNYKSYRSISSRRAEKIGYSVIDYAIDDELELHPSWSIYPNGPVGDVSFAPTGVAALGKGNERREHIDLPGVAAFNAWDDHVSRMAKLVGYDIVDYLDARRVVDDVSTDAYDDLVKKTSESIRDIVAHMSELDATEPLNEQLLKEGGAYGHMAHVFDDMELTFGDLKTLIDLSLQGKLDVESGLTEKLDGQAISVSWKNGKLIAARNKGQLKGYGANALDVPGLKQMFAGRGELSNAFSYAVEDLEKAISKLSDAQRNKIFNEGHLFMAVEIIYPATENVVPYGMNMLVFHGTIEYDEQGNAIGSGPKDSARVLAGMIKQVNANVQKSYTIEGPQVLTLPKAQNYSSRKSYYMGKVSSLQRVYKLKDSDAVMMWHQAWWEEFLDKEANKVKYSLPNHVKMGLVKRWAFMDKSYSVNDMKRDIDNEGFLKFVLSFDKSNHKKQFDDNIWKFESIFLELGTEILKNVSGFISASPDSSVQKMKRELDTAISELQKTKDIKKLELLSKHLRKLQSVGGTDSIVPSEGIVFTYKGKTYKITGSFASLNQILGALKF
jgi:hypothetical protein